MTCHMMWQQYHLLFKIWCTFDNYLVLLIKLLYSSLSKKSFSIDNIANPFNLFYDMVDLN